MEEVPVNMRDEIVLPDRAQRDLAHRQPPARAPAAGIPP
jgi:hypothetical protein